MIAAGIPVIRGTNGAVLDLEEGKKKRRASDIL